MRKRLLIACAFAAVFAFGEETDEPSQAGLIPGVSSNVCCSGWLDLRGGTLLAKESEAVAYSPRWGGAASCEVAVDGNRLLSNAAEEGEISWTPSGAGCHVLTHTAGGETYTARLVVLGAGVVLHTGLIASDETWDADKTHLIDGALCVASNATLTVARGAVVKFTPGASLDIADGGTCVAAGVIFTHVNDDFESSGGDTLGDGNATVPAMGEYAIAGNVVDDAATQYRYLKFAFGVGGAFGATGTLWLEEGPYVAHEVEHIGFSPRWGGAASCEIVVDGVRLLSNAVEEGEFEWHPQGEGVHTLTHQSGGETLTAQFMVLNNAFVHDGTIGEDETWHTGKVHVVSRDVTVADGATLTIEPGSVVKFLDGKVLKIEAGGIVIAEGVVFTSIHDDTAGGDTLCDGSATQAEENAYRIAGFVQDDLATEYRYGVQSYSGTLAGEVTWRKEKTYVIDGTLTVATNGVLTIPAGTVVKFTDGSSLQVAAGGVCAVAGAIFTHIADDAVGGDTLGDGDETKPEYGKYTVAANVIDSNATEYRYSAPISTSGTLTGNNIWRARQVYRVTGNLKLAGGATLMIAPGTVVKFDPGCSLTVDAGATLDAQGTRSSPVVFTSIKDDAHGGDTNGDGEKTYAQAGDWHQITGSGTVTMNYCEVLWCSAQNNQGALYPNGGTWQFDNSIVAHCEYDCMRNYSGTFMAKNSVFMEASMGAAPASGNATFVNCVFAYLTTAVRWGNGTFHNCIFSDITEDIIDTKFYDSTLMSQFYHCCFWNPKGTGDHATALVGKNGNIWADPLFNDSDNGDFRIAANSPCVDAGDGTVAPAKDYYNQPRQGVPDIGIYETQPRGAKSDVDLAAVSVSGASEATAGGELKVSWTVENIGTAATDTLWHDAIDLIDASGRVVELSPRQPAMPLAPGVRRTQTAVFTVPAIAPGKARLRLRVNPGPPHDLYEGSQTANNIAYSESAVRIRLNSLDALPDGGRLDLAAGSSASFQLASGGTRALVIGATGAMSAYAGAGYVPVARKNDSVAIPLSDGRMLLVLPASEQDVFVVLENESGMSQTLRVETLDETVAVLDLSSDELSASASACLVMTGTGFGSVAGVSLEGASTVSASGVDLLSAGEIAATFDLSSIAEGRYAITLETESGETVRTGCEVAVCRPKTGAKLEASLDIPSTIRLGRTYSGRIRYANTGDMPMDVPYFVLESAAKLRLPGDGEWTAGALRILAAKQAYPSGELAPGESAFVEFEFASDVSQPRFSLNVESDDGAGWSGERGALCAAATRLGLLGRVEPRIPRLEAVEAEAEALVGGILLDATTGEPLDGATVAAMLPDGTSLDSSETDADGVFVIAGIPHATNIAVFVQSGAFANAVVARVPETGDLPGVTLAGSFGKTIRLAVSGMEEGEHANATVSRIDSAAGDVRAEIAGGASTNLTVAGAGVYIVCVETSGGIRKISPVLVESDDGTVDVEIDLASGFDISGYVEDADGNRVEGAVVTLDYAGSASARPFSCMTDASGLFRFRRIDDGAYTIHATCTGYGDDAASRVEVAGADVDAGTLSVFRYANVVRGTVANAPEGAGVGFTMRFAGVAHSCAVAADGSFMLDALPEGIGDLVVFDAEGNAVSVERDFVVKPGTNVVSMTVVDSTYFIRAVAVDEDGERVNAVWRFVSSEGDGKTVNPGSDGAALAALRGGDYDVTVAAPGFLPASFRTRVDSSKEQSVVLSRAGRVLVDGADVEDGMISDVYFVRDGAVSAGTVSADGTSASGDFAGGANVSAFVVAPRAAYMTRTAAVTSGETSKLAVLHDGRPLEIKLVGEKGTVDHIRIEHLDGPALEAAFLPIGETLALSAYPAVSARASAVAADGTVLASAEIAADAAEATLTIDGLQTIAGVVVGENRSFAGGVVSLFRDGIKVCGGRLAASGAFRLVQAPEDFDAVWVELNDGTVFSYSKPEAEASGWRLEIPDDDEMGIVQTKVVDAAGHPVVNAVVTFTAPSGYVIVRRTNSKGQAETFQKKDGGTVKIDVPAATSDVPPPPTVEATPQTPAHCPECGNYPCRCRAKETSSTEKACPSCGRYPCACTPKEVVKPSTPDQSKVAETPIPQDALESLIDRQYMDELVAEEILPMTWHPLDFSWARRYESRIQSLMRRLSSIHKERDPEYPTCVASGCDYNQRVWRAYLRNSALAGTACSEASALYEEVLMRSRTQAGGYFADVLSAGMPLASSRIAVEGVKAAVNVTANVLAIVQGAIEGGWGGLVGSSISVAGAEAAPNAMLNWAWVRNRLGLKSPAWQWRENSELGANAIGSLMAAKSVWDRTSEMNACMAELNSAVSHASRAVSLAAAAARRPYRECKSVRPRTRKVEEKQPVTPISCDPNEVRGPEGVGADRYILAGTMLEYTVFFENDKDAQTAPLDIVVDNPLDPALDPATFELVEIGVANQIDTSLKGLRSGESLVAQNGTPYHVAIKAGFSDSAVKLELHIVDKSTKHGTPEDPFAGILPPNDDTHRGEGHITYRIKLRDDAAPNSKVVNSATIVFDTNDPIETNPSWTNTVAEIANVTLSAGGVETNLELIVGAPYGDALPDAPVNAKPGYTFAGWRTGPNGTGRIVTAESLVEAGDSGIYADWAANTYEVAFLANGGEGEMPPQTNTYDFVSSLATNVFTRTGYRHLGWATNETGGVVYEDGAAVSNLTTVAGGSVNLYAVWEVFTMEVAFDLNYADATGRVPPMVVTNGLAYGVLPVGEREGYAFDGWANGQADRSPRVTETAIVTNETDHTLYAQWVANEYTVRFNANGGEGTMGNQTFEFDQSDVLDTNVFVRIGYGFTGWATNETGEADYADGAEVLNLAAENGAVIDLYAVWAATTAYTKFVEVGGATDEGSNAAVRVHGGNADAASSVKVYLTYNTAAAADVDVAKGTVADGGGRGATALPDAAVSSKPPYQTNLKFPLTLTWEKGEVGEKVITIPVKTDKTVEGDEFFTLQLAEAEGMELGEERVCTVTIRDATVAAGKETLQDAVNNAVVKMSTSGKGKWAYANVGTGGEAAPGKTASASAMSPILKAGEMSELKAAAVKGSGTLTFDVRVANPNLEGESPEAADGAAKTVLTLLDGKAELLAWTNETDWTSASYAVEEAKATSHAFTWRVVQGADLGAHAYVANVVWSPAGTEMRALTLAAEAYIGGEPCDDSFSGGTVSGEGVYPDKTKISLAATAKVGWEFVGWAHGGGRGATALPDDGDGRAGSPLPAADGEILSNKAKWQVVVTNDAEYVAVFEKIPYVRGLADPADGGKVSGSGYCAAGKKVTLKASANKNFAFLGWVRGGRGATALPGDGDGRAGSPLPADENGFVATTASLVIDRSAKPAANSKTSTTVTGIDGDVTYFAVFKSDPKVTVSVEDTDEKGAALTGKGAGKYVAGTITGAGKYAPGKKVTLKAAANKGYVFAGWYDGAVNALAARSTSATGETPVVPVSQAASLSFVMPSNDVEYVAMFVTADEDKASIALAVDGTEMRLAGDGSPHRTNIWAGVYLKWPVAASALSETEVKVAGLPSGLKFTDKPVTSKTGSGKTAVVVTNVLANTIYGAPTAASKVRRSRGDTPYQGYEPSQVKVTVTTAGKSTQTYQIDTVVDALPAWAQGTFAGGGRGAPALPGQVSLTVSAAGKVSGKALGDGLTYTLAAPYYSGFEMADGVSNFVADLTASWSYKEGTKTVKTNDVVQVAVADNGIGGYAAAEDWFEAYTVNWKADPWKALGKKFDKKTLTYAILDDGTFSEDEEVLTSALGADVTARVTLKFAASGAVSVAGEFAMYDKNKAKYTTVKASGSATLVPVDDEHGEVFFYLLPKGLPPHARSVRVPWSQE